MLALTIVVCLFVCASHERFKKETNLTSVFQRRQSAEM